MIKAPIYPWNHCLLTHGDCGLLRVLLGEYSTIVGAVTAFLGVVGGKSGGMGV